MPKLTVDGLDLNTEDLSERGRAVLASLQFADGQIERLRHEIAICRTARASYAEALKAEIAAATGAAATGAGVTGAGVTGAGVTGA